MELEDRQSVGNAISIDEVPGGAGMPEAKVDGGFAKSWTNIFIQATTSAQDSKDQK